MYRFYTFGLGLLFCGLLAGGVRAATFQLNDGSTVEGEIILPATGDGLNIRVDEGKYQRVPWTGFAQSTLQELARNPKLTQFAEPYLEIPEAEKIKKTDVPITQPPRLERPAKGSVLGALFNSSVGLVALLLIFAANIYAGYEIAIFRARPVVLVCATAALLPMIGPVFFLLMPTRVKYQEGEKADEEEIIEITPAHETIPNPPAPGGLGLARAEAAPAASSAPQIQVFQRGQFTFNRRFFETRFPGFFGVIRRDAEKDTVLLIKTPRGLFVVNRITRIAASDLHAEVHHGSGSEEVMIPFAEIQEIQLKYPHA